MNNLSLVIYLADVIPAVGALFGGLAIVTGILTVLVAIGYMFNSTEAHESERAGMERWILKEQKNAALCAYFFRWTLAIFFITIIPAIIIPKRDTIMMIAASEFGETALKSDDVQEIVNPAKKILKNWINDQLAQSEKKK